MSVPYDAVPKHLKSIVLSVYDTSSHKKVTTYLLKLRSDNAAYEVMFRSSAVVGEGKLILEVFDYETALVRRITRTVVYTTSMDKNTDLDNSSILSVYLWWAVGVFGVTLLFWWWFLLRRRSEDKA